MNKFSDFMGLKRGQQNDNDDEDDEEQ